MTKERTLNWQDMVDAIINQAVEMDATLGLNPANIDEPVSCEPRIEQMVRDTHNMMCDGSNMNRYSAWRRLARVINRKWELISK